MYYVICFVLWFRIIRQITYMLHKRLFCNYEKFQFFTTWKLFLRLIYLIFIQQRNITLNRLLEMLHLEETFKNIFWWNAIRHGMKVYKLLTMDEILLPNSRSWYMILKGLLPFPWWSQRLVYNTHMKKFF